MSTALRGEQILPEGEVLRVSEGQAAGAFFSGLLLFVVGAATLLSKTGGHSVPLWVAPLTGVVGIALGIDLMARSRAGLIVERDGISVQAAYRRRRWKWSQLKNFELTGAYYGAGLRVELIDGETIGVRGFNARSKDQRTLAQARVEELTRRAEQAQTVGR